MFISGTVRGLITAHLRFQIEMLFHPLHHDRGRQAGAGIVKVQYLIASRRIRADGRNIDAHIALRRKNSTRSLY